MNLTVDTGHTSNTTTTILCPHDGRRSSKELWVKLFVIHLTTIAAFCHVLSVRREPIIRWKLIFYIFVPYTIFAYHVLALFGFLCGLVYYLIKPSEEVKDSLWRTPLCSAWRPDGGATEKESKFKKVGRVLLASTFLVQCIGTTVLYSHRRQHHAVTFADQRVFELGCTGILTALYWLAHTLELPPFSQPAPNLHQDAKSAYDKFILDMRDCQTPPLSGYSNKVLSFFKHGAVSLILLIAQRKVRIFQFAIALIHDIFTGSDTTSANDQTLEFMLFICGISAGGLVSVLAFCGQPTSRISRMRGKKRKGLGSGSKDQRPWWMFFLCPCGMALFWIPAVLALGGLFVFAYFCLQWGNIGAQIAHLDSWPTDTACPLLWSDPAANWIWALA